MWLRIDAEGIIIQLQIREYAKSTRENWDIEWCKVDFSFKAGEWLDYHMEEYECFLACEIEMVEDKFTRFINGEIKKEETMDFLEPDFEFLLDPKTGYIDWKISFWHEGLTANYLSIALSEDDIIVFRDYLQLVIGKLQESDDRIKNLIKSGNLYGN